MLAGAAALLVAGLAALAGWFLFASNGPNRAELITDRVARGTLQMTVTERGTLEAARNEDVYCRVKTGGQGSAGLPQIKTVIPDGSQVKKGDLLVEIETSRFEDQLKTQEIAVLQAESAWKQAEEAYNIVVSQNLSEKEAAQLKLKLTRMDELKYLKGEYLQSQRDISGRTRVAESDLEMAMDRAAWAERMRLKAYFTRTQARAEQAKVLGSLIALEKVEGEMRVLEDYTKPRTLLQLGNDIRQAELDIDRLEKQARAKLVQADTDRQVKDSVYRKEQKRYQEIKEELDKCKIFAPQDGLVIYHIPESSSRSGGGGPRSTIAQGESVWEGQKLMRLPDLKHMVVNARVHEALISRVKVGQEAQVRVDAFSERALRARVKQVANVAAKSDYFSSSDVKLYPTIVEVLDEVDDLRPDMSAEVTIFTDAPMKNVLIVPLQAIAGPSQQGKNRKCYVLTARGVEERDVVVGLSNDTHAEIREGLKEGEEVIVNPRVLLGEKDKAKATAGDNRSNGDDRPASPASDSRSNPDAGGSKTGAPPHKGAPPQGGSEGSKGGSEGKKGGPRKGPPPGPPAK